MAETLHRYRARLKLSYSPVKRPGTVTNRFVLETKFQSGIKYYDKRLQVFLKDFLGFFFEIFKIPMNNIKNRIYLHCTSHVYKSF